MMGSTGRRALNKAPPKAVAPAAAPPNAPVKPVRAGIPVNPILAIPPPVARAVRRTADKFAMVVRANVVTLLTAFLARLIVDCCPSRCRLTVVLAMARRTRARSGGMITDSRIDLMK